MGLPAARVGDSTLHGPPITGAGCPKVLLGGRPAWRMGGDQHTCSMVNAPPPVGPGTPHAVGVGTMGSATVMFGSMPSMRMTDIITEPAAVVPFPPPNLILSGEFRVLIGGPTVVMTVNPATGECTCEYSDNITIQGTPEFVARCLCDMATLNSIPSGKRLLADINSSNNHVTIMECGPNADGADDRDWSSPNLTNGTGEDATIYYHPHEVPMYGNGEAWDNPPTAVTLGHELTHGSHIVNGDLPGDVSTGAPLPGDSYSGLPGTRAQEERRTVGLPADPAHGVPDYSNEPYSENSIRSDLGEPTRTTYLDPTSRPHVW